MTKRLHLLGSIYHSFDTRGSFVELAIKRGFPINKKLHVGILGVMGANAGYVADGRKGLNHFQIRANNAYHPVAQLEIYAYTSYNQAINDNREKYADDESLDDFTWGGLGLTYRF